MKENGEEEHKDVAHRTIFHELLSSDELPPEEKAVQRLADEAQTIIGAGTIRPEQYVDVLGPFC